MRLSIYYQNCRGLRTKSDIKKDISASSYDIICLSETWLNEDIDSSAYFDDSYTVYRHDKNYNTDSLQRKRGGGCLIAIKAKISSIQLKNWEDEIPLENVWVAVNLRGTKNRLLINVCYIEPSRPFSFYETYYTHVENKLCAQEPQSEYIIMGDFNLPNIKWESSLNGAMAPITYEGRCAEELINLMTLTDLRQLNYLKNAMGRTLDLALSNCNEISLSATPALSKIDNFHPPFELELTNNKVKFLKAKKDTKLNYYKMEYNKVNDELANVDWQSALNCDNMDISSATSNFYNIINDIINRNAPKIYPKTDDYPKWFTKELINLIKEKDSLRKRFKKQIMRCFTLCLDRKGVKLNIKLDYAKETI